MKRITSILTVALMVGLLAGAVVAKDNPMIAMETTEGKMVIELFEKEAPVTVQNFLWYVENGFYDGLIFHRVIDGFMIQGGGFTEDMQKKAGNPEIDNEATNGLTNDKYTLAMARTNAVHSASSQFFVNVKDNAALNHRDTSSAGFGYCVFGKVVDGMDTVDAIKGVPTGTKGGYNDVPKTAVVIKSAYRCDAKGKKIKEKEKEKDSE
jgi:peptidyl-prolyl cis-trans isomerase B (cyclophilin B)